MYIYIYTRVIHKQRELFWKKEKNFFQIFISINVNSKLFIANNITNIFCSDSIENGNKSNTGIQAWKEVYHQIFAVWKVQTIWNWQKNVWCVQRSMFYSTTKKKFMNGLKMPQHAWVGETERKHKGKISGFNVQKRRLYWHSSGTWKDLFYRFPRNRFNSKQCFLFPTSSAIFPFIHWLTLIYIYIYIYIYIHLCVCVCVCEVY